MVPRSHCWKLRRCEDKIIELLLSELIRIGWRRGGHQSRRVFVGVFEPRVSDH
jgi:hypothetical protein